MAVEILDYQGFSKLRSDGDADDSASTSIQALISLLAQKQQQLGEAQKEVYCHMADATTYEFKKLIAALGGSGHARFRRAPGGSPASAPSQTPFDKVRHSPSLHDATQPVRTLDISVPEAQISTPNSSCSPCKNGEDVPRCDLRANTHHASHISGADMPIAHVSSSCCPGKEHSAVNGSIYNGNTHTKPLFKDQSPSVSHVYGHARCRDATTQKLCHQGSARPLPTFSQAQQSMSPQLRRPLPSQIVASSCAELDQDILVASTTNSSFVSSLSMERGGTVSNGKPVFSSGRPPLPPKKRKAPEEKIEERSQKCHKSGQCHCAKSRNLKSRTILRVSATGPKDTDIPADGFSWCKYGEKLSSKGSLHSRVYYKCSSVRGCPARKHVQRALDDPNMMIVTYGREHLHPQIRNVHMTSD
eukprot:c21471_g1_i1 orf=178-1425(-)